RQRLQTNNANLRRCAPTARPDERGIGGRMLVGWVAGWRGMRTLPKLPFPALDLKLPFRLRCYGSNFPNGVETMASEYSLSVVLERIYENQQALEAATMELTLVAEQQGFAVAGDNPRTARDKIGENAGFIKQGLARLRTRQEDSLVIRR
ncbi:MULTISPECIES: hypothetical protein, partial [unclassified Pseudomonas]